MMKILSLRIVAIFALLFSLGQPALVAENLSQDAVHPTEVSTPVTEASPAGKAASSPPVEQIPPASNQSPAVLGAEETRQVSWKTIIPNIASDQKTIWLSPLKLRERKYWLPVGAVVGATAAIVAADPAVARYFRGTRSLDGFNNAFSGTITERATLIAPLSLYALGLIRKDSKMKTTAMLAAEAVASSEIVTTVFKDIDRRSRPIAISENASFADSWFKDNTRYLRSNGSFPSGHTIAAFSIATVFSRRYGKTHRWVPYVAYGSAALVGFSRISLSAHFASDVFAGAALGYSISRFTVLRQ